MARVGDAVGDAVHYAVEDGEPVAATTGTVQRHDLDVLAAGTEPLEPGADRADVDTFERGRQHHEMRVAHVHGPGGPRLRRRAREHRVGDGGRGH